MIVKAKYIIGAAVLLGAAIIGATAFQGSVTPYVGFAEARASGHRCQVMGEIVHERTSYEVASQTLLFTIVDELGDPLEVAYQGIMPGNFEQATSVVAKGHYADPHFVADELLVKCPSKYQGGELDRDSR
jgi:cytochrome c-type biogenesis protein CcmE